MVVDEMMIDEVQPVMHPLSKYWIAKANLKKWLIEELRSYPCTGRRKKRITIKVNRILRDKSWH